MRFDDRWPTPQTPGGPPHQDLRPGRGRRRSRPRRRRRGEAQGPESWVGRYHEIRCAAIVRRVPAHASESRVPDPSSTGFRSTGAILRVQCFDSWAKNRRADRKRRKRPGCRRFVSYGGVTAAVKRAVEVQPAAEGRSFQVVMDGERTRQSQRLMEARFDCAERGSRARSGSAHGTKGCMCTKQVFRRARSGLSNSLSPLRLRISSRRRRRTGNTEVDGSDPPFLLPGAGAGVLRDSHLRNTPWGGRSRPNYP